MKLSNEHIKIVEIQELTPSRVITNDWCDIMVVSDVSFVLSIPRNIRVAHDLVSTKIVVIGMVNSHCYILPEYENKVTQAKNNNESLTDIIKEEILYNQRFYDRFAIYEDEADLFLFRIEGIKEIAKKFVEQGYSCLEIKLNESKFGKNNHTYGIISFYPTKVIVTTETRNNDGYLDERETILTNLDEIYEFFMLMREL